ncbi:MAG: short-chain dehydrogenase/reductase [Cryptosporangiaceae bacterium]|jgi:3-oxoacyl-[acyl-carrier protein] reductase|nr:short-chain dehydrogenase/reductase [Cryptosporangiaceae bacterium]
MRRTAVVTGVSRRIGIGAAISRRLAADGFDLLLHSWAPHDAEQPWGADEGWTDEFTRELRETGARVEHVAADLADPRAPAELVRRAVEAYGHLDVVVANHARGVGQALEDLTATELDLTYAVNTRATLLLVQQFAAQHDGRPGGRIVLMTSGQHRGPMPAELPYIASKGALHQLTGSLSAHLAPRGITVNTVDPGATDTGYASDAVLRAVLAEEPQGRWGEPDDAARLVAWLAGEESRWVTGQVIVSSGGGP